MFNTTVLTKQAHSKLLMMKQQLRVSRFPDALQPLSFATRCRLGGQVLNKLEDRSITFIKSNVHVRQLQTFAPTFIYFFFVHD